MVYSPPEYILLSVMSGPTSIPATLLFSFTTTYALVYPAGEVASTSYNVPLTLLLNETVYDPVFPELNPENLTM